MATIAENIQTLKSIKSDIKNAIIQKGGSVTDAFGTYAQAITNLPSGGGGGTEIEDGLITRTLSGTYYNDRISMVGGYAFSGCSALASIDLPNCTKVYEKAFNYCASLQSFDLPNCLYISDYAFYSCQKLSLINLPKCKSLGNYVFQNCRSLIYFNLPLCEYVGYGALYNCLALQSFDLPKCSYICDYAFFSCQKLSLINLPKCKSLGGYACYQCSSISTIKIPVCSYISYCTFQSCTNLKEVYLNSVTSVTTIASDTFSYCPNLTSVYVPSSLVDAFKTAQYWSSISTKIVAYREPTEPTKYPPLVYSAKSAGSTITVNGQPMTLEQGDNIEMNYANEITSVEATGNEELTYLQIPNTVTSINDNAFGDCVALTSVTLPDSLTSIGDGAFQCCIGLTSINIPSGVTSISMETFNGCSALASVTLPEGLTNIGSSTFMDCTSLTSITIPSTVTMIDFEAFNYCEALTDFNFNGTMEQWRAITLGNDWNLKAAFTVVHCSDGDVTLEEPIQPIQPNNLVYSTNAAGSKLTVNGQSITLEQGDDITLDYPNEITSVRATDNTALTTIQIPNTVTRIEDGAFRGCQGLVTIIIPESVTSIGSASFNNCYALTDFHFNGTMEQWEAISKGNDWNLNATFFVVYCTDGEVNIL